MTVIKSPSKYSISNSNEIHRKRLESEYFDIKNLAFVLFDLIPYEKKDLMISKFEELFSSTQMSIYEGGIKKRIRDFTSKESRIIKMRLGSIYNSKKTKSFEKQPLANEKKVIFNLDMVMLDLPVEIDYIDISIGQEVDFSYYVYYYCYINKDYWNKDIRYTFVHSQDSVEYQTKDGIGWNPRGPEFDPTIRDYEDKTVKFLSNYVEGLFINKEFSNNSVPSIRILSTSSIDISNVSEWERRHFKFLRYLRLNFFNIDHYNKCSYSFIFFQHDTIFETTDVSKGITMLYPEQYVPESGDREIIDAILSSSKVYVDSIINYFHAYYWSAFNIYYHLEHKKKELKEITKYMLSDKSNSLDQKKNMGRIANFYVNFSTYSNKEKINIRISRENFKYKRDLEGPPVFTIRLYQFEFFKTMSKIIEEKLDTENILIEDIQKQIDILFSYYKDVSNFDLNFSNILLQKGIRSLTIITIILTAINVIMTVID